MQVVFPCINGSFCIFMKIAMWKLSNLCTARQALVWEDYTCTAIRSICRTNHTIALYAAEFCRLTGLPEN